MKKVVTLALIVLISITASTSVFALEINSESVSFEQEKLKSIAEKVANSLAEIEPIRKELGFESIDFYSLYLGEPINVYETSKEGIVPLRTYFPIFCEDRLVALAIGIDNNHYQVSRSLCDEIGTFASRSIALIYDNTSCYVFDEKQYTLIFKGGFEVEERVPLTRSNKASEIIKTSYLSAKFPINYDPCISKGVMQNYYSCNITGVPQKYDKICWAASWAVILNATGTVPSPVTAPGVASSILGTNFNHTRTDSNTVSDMILHYGLHYVYNNSVLSDTVLKNNIIAGNPIYASFLNLGGTVRHACTIYGINMVSGYVSVMDPWGSDLNHTYSYAAYYSTLAGGYTYTNIYNSTQFILSRTICESTS